MRPDDLEAAHETFEVLEEDGLPPPTHDRPLRRWLSRPGIVLTEDPTTHANVRVTDHLATLDLPRFERRGDTLVPSSR